MKSIGRIGGLKRCYRSRAATAAEPQPVRQITDSELARLIDDRVQRAIAAYQATFAEMISNQITDMSDEIAQLMGEELKKSDGDFDTLRKRIDGIDEFVKHVNEKLIDNLIEMKAKSAEETERVVKKLGGISKTLTTLDRKIANATGTSATVTRLHG